MDATHDKPKLVSETTRIPMLPSLIVVLVWSPRNPGISPFVFPAMASTLVPVTF